MFVFEIYVDIDVHLLWRVSEYSIKNGVRIYLFF